MSVEAPERLTGGCLRGGVRVVASGRPFRELGSRQEAIAQKVHPGRTRRRSLAYDGRVEGVTIPCTRCGAPLPIMLGRRGVKCRYCGTKQPIPKEAEARLRRHFHRIEAILEVAHLERTREKRRAPAYLVVTFLIAFIAIPVGLVTRRFDVMLIGGGVYFVLMIAVGIREHLGATLRRAPAPEAGRVRCDNCGAEVPFVVSEESLECPVCDRPIALDAGALAHAVRVAQADLARAAEESGDPYRVTSRD